MQRIHFYVLRNYTQDVENLQRKNSVLAMENKVLKNWNSYFSYSLEHMKKVFFFQWVERLAGKKHSGTLIITTTQVL